MAEPRFLLDSNICIYLLGGSSDKLRERVEAFDPGDLAASAVAYAETMLGARRSDTVPQAEALFRIITVLPFDATSAERYSELPFRRGSYDRLIAAHALSLGLPLVTNNTADFADIPGLKVENWTL